ncbi:MAG: hypothetical protein Q7V56_04285 [Gammaproteobacteria bacterium]|nr:hypothetical protein [Gammaproteobacteria bacterium]
MKDHNSKPNSPELFIDNERYDWHEDTITGAQLRQLGALPDDVQIFWKNPGHPDLEVKNDTVINLKNHPGPDRFSTQSVGSQAG